MSIDLVLNELSLRSSAESAERGMELMRGLADTIFAAGRAGSSKFLRVPRGFHAMMLGPSYPVGRWTGDKRVPEEYRRLFLLWATKSPFLDQVLERTANDTLARSEYRHAGEICEGLAVAKIIGGLSISFFCPKEWHSPTLSLGVFELNEEGLEGSEYDCEVKHASTVAHVNEHSGWIGNRRRLSVDSGEDCIGRLADLFPKVNLCDNASRQLSDLGRGEELFRAAYAALEDLSNYAITWQDGGFIKTPLTPCSEESRSTLDLFGEERTFLCPDGVKRTFSWHLKRGRWRIYFKPDESERTFLIGYIGKHLRTARFQ
jgi:hypothetical protein